jgi:type II secretory pathway pseudopilin PulG
MRRARGFSFTEILFAVMILGIGFIMVAAMFPVAIRQTEANSRETITASVGRSSAEYLSKMALVQWPPGAAAGAFTESILRPTLTSAPPLASIMIPAGQTSFVIPGQVWSMFDSRDTVTSGVLAHNAFVWQSVCNNAIVPGDPRYAWVGMWKRDFIATGPPGAPATGMIYGPSAQIILIGIKSTIRPAYLSTDVQNPPTATCPFLPHLLAAQISRSATGYSTAVITSTNNPINSPLAEGAYIVISDDSYTATNQHGVFTGRIFRLGTFISRAGRKYTYQLLPGSDLTPGDAATMTSLGFPATLNVTVLLVGAAPATTTTFSGPAQDVAVYTTYVQTN